MTGGHSQDLSPRIDPANLLCLTWLADCHARPKSLIKIMSGVKSWTSPVFRPYPLTELAPWLSAERGNPTGSPEEKPRGEVEGGCKGGKPRGEVKSGSSEGKTSLAKAEKGRE